MHNLYIFTLFNGDGGLPRCTGVKIGSTLQIYDLYQSGARKLIGLINKNKRLVGDLIIAASKKGVPIITSDFKNHLVAFDLPLDTRTYNVYDMHLPDLKPGVSTIDDHRMIEQVLFKMVDSKPKEYQKIYANAAVVYQDLQNRGLTNNYVLEYPLWSQKVFSGRSKTSGFNIQGFIYPHLILPPNNNPKNVLIHFDWISADIRAAAILSGDQRLAATFENSDPYTYMMTEINKDSETKIGRDDCKSFLLKSINSMDVTGLALAELYKELGAWIARCRQITADHNGYLETVLQRRFRALTAKNNLAVLNGAMQGSVAHAMQIVLRKIWERAGHNLVAEIHDSLVMAAPIELVKATINMVAPIMLRPFTGLLPDDPVFPFKVSIGKRWKRWRLIAVYRANGVEYVTPAQRPSTYSPSCNGTGPPPQAEVAGPSEEIFGVAD